MLSTVPHQTNTKIWIRLPKAKGIQACRIPTVWWQSPAKNGEQLGTMGRPGHTQFLVVPCTGTAVRTQRLLGACWVLQ